MTAYAIRSGARAAAKESADTRSAELVRTFRDAELTHRKGLEWLAWLPELERAVGEIKRRLRAWADKEGPFEADGGRWGPVVSHRTQNVSMRLSELMLLLADCEISKEHRDRVVAKLEARGVGRAKPVTSYKWHR